MAPIVYSNFTNDEIVNKAKAIARSSFDDQEIEQRLKDELGYP